MASLEKVSEGLQILARYGKGDVQAEHDEIFAGGKESTPERMRSEDLERLGELGWTWDSDLQSWKRFT